MEQFKISPERAREDTQEANPESYREIVYAVNEKELFFLIAEDVAKAGVDSRILNRLVPLKKVVVKSDDLDAYGRYSQDEGAVVQTGLDSDSRLQARYFFEQIVKGDFEERQNEIEEILKNDTHPLFLAMRSILVIKVLIHEELHALSDAGVTVESEFDCPANFLKIKTTRESSTIGFDRREKVSTSNSLGLEYGVVVESALFV